MGFYVDLRTFVLVYDMTDGRLSRDEQLAVEESLRRHGHAAGAAYEVLTGLGERHTTLIRHENHHFWQHIYFPFLYLHAATVWKWSTDQWREVVKRPPFDWRTEPVEVQDVWARFSFAVRVKIERGVVYAEPVAGDDGDRTLSIWELMEGATSLFEYRASEGGAGSWTGFQKWCSKNHAYRNAADAIDEVMLSKSFQMLPIFTAVAFHTTDPVLAFLDLLEWFAQSAHLWPMLDLDDDEKLLRWVFKQAKKKYRPAEVLPDGRMLGPGEQPWWIDGRALDGLASPHPLLAPYRSRWLEINRTRPGLESMFVLPFEGDQFERQKMLMEFRAPIVMVILADPRSSGGYTVLPLIEDEQRLDRATVQWVLQAYAIFQALDEISGHGQADTHHPCPQTSCRFHATNLCRGNFSPPQPSNDPEHACWFPAWLQDAGMVMREPFVLAPRES